uniref:Regulatory protein, RpfE type n=1 Tax=Polynucleobacter necessarius subsp. necessarius (strain STIR1) TaxID=452638 RepID=B1XTS7_POLNS
MPPKIRGMTANSISAKAPLRRFTLMISGEDVLDELDSKDGPRRGLPHERFLLGELAPIAPVLLLGQSNQAVDPAKTIACLQPVHLHATRDHLILMGQNQIDLTEEESAQLLKTALPFIEEDFQNSILFQNQHYWFIPAGPFSSLASYSVDQAHGRNIDWWMPHDTQEAGIAKRWRKLQNEIQMLWHINPVNEEREQRGMPSINSIWISGIGSLNDVQAAKTLKQSQCLIGQHPILLGLAKLLKLSHEDVLNERNPAGAFAWLERPELSWPQLSEALLSKKIEELAIIDFPNGEVRERIFTAKDLNKKSWVFWKKSKPLTWKEITQA